MREEVEAEIEAGVILVTSLRMAAISSLVLGITCFFGGPDSAVVVGVMKSETEGVGVGDVFGRTGGVVVVVAM